MKKDKKEIVLFILTILFVITAIFFYFQSQKMVVTSEIPYSEGGSTSYRVHLSDSTYYNKDYLDEGMQYISSIIDYVDVDFRYSADYMNVSSYTVSKKAIAKVIITDADDTDKIIYTKQDILKDEHVTTDGLDIYDSLRIDYKKYNDLVNEIKTKYGIGANCTLDVEYDLVYVAKEEGINRSRILNISIPLSKQMINITKSTPINNKGTYTTQAVNSPISGVMTLFFIFMSAFAVCTGSIFILRIKDRIKKESKYDRFISKVLKEYDSYITEAQGNNYIPDKAVIKINSFKELLDVRNNIDKTIVYTKLDANTSKFQIIDEEIYEYKVSREDMDE